MRISRMRLTKPGSGERPGGGPPPQPMASSANDVIVNDVEERRRGTASRRTVTAGRDGIADPRLEDPPKVGTSSILSTRRSGRGRWRGGCALPAPPRGGGHHPPVPV